MERLKMPRYILWLIITTITFLLVMSILRLGLVFWFNLPGDLSSVVPSLVLGSRLDLRVICIFTLLQFIIGSIPAFHPLQKKAGQAVAFSLWSIFILLFCLFYVLDYTHYSYLAKRLNSHSLNYFRDASITAKQVWQSNPIIWFILLIVSGFLLLIGAVRLAYNHVLSRRITATKRSRVVWGVAFLLLLIFGIHGRIAPSPLRWVDEAASINEYNAQMALNPIQSFMISLIRSS